MAPLPPFEQSYSFHLNVNKGSRATSGIIVVRITEVMLFPIRHKYTLYEILSFCEAYFVQGK